MLLKTDYLVLGSGIAGLSFAIKVAEHYEQLGERVRIDVFSKSTLEESNTKYAQGGIAAVQNKVSDSFEKHIKDTMRCGLNMSDKTVVEQVVKAAPEQIETLLSWGVTFDRNQQGSYDLAREGGHSESRILHTKDYTGLEIESALLHKAKSHSSIHMHYNSFAIDLFIEQQQCYGAIIVDSSSGHCRRVYASYTLLATGGVGQVYKTTTNPVIATGDGIAMAYRAGAEIKGMEFVQFHPTALYSEGSPSFLISEAVRGFGAVLRNHRGEDFCSKYDPRASLAPRDIVARAIAKEIQSGNTPYVTIDLSALQFEQFKRKFPSIYKKCVERGIDILRDGIPVVPAAHYLCGGIVVDANGESSIKGLLACGECANTGLHGANRLASNSLLEAIVYADYSFQYVVKNKRLTKVIAFQKAKYPLIPEDRLLLFKKKLQRLMTKYANIVKSPKGLKKALFEIELLENEIDSYRSTIDVSSLEYMNMLVMSKLIVKQALAREKNIGLHYLEE